LSYFAVSLPNRPGELAKFADDLATAGINLVGLWGEARGGRPLLSCVPESPGAFRQYADSVGLRFEEGKTFYRTGDDKPGALVQSLQRIADAGINIDAIETVGAGPHFGCFLWADEGDWPALQKLLA
jgi:hypothetical protein